MADAGSIRHIANLGGLVERYFGLKTSVSDAFDAPGGKCPTLAN